jgi:hypothetical protein
MKATQFRVNDCPYSGSGQNYRGWERVTAVLRKVDIIQNRHHCHQGSPQQLGLSPATVTAAMQQQLRPQSILDVSAQLRHDSHRYSMTSQHICPSLESSRACLPFHLQLRSPFALLRFRTASQHRAFQYTVLDPFMSALWPLQVAALSCCSVLGAMGSPGT